MIKKLHIQTQQRTEAINITRQLGEMVSDVSDGLALFYIPHTTAALLIGEDDAELRNDLVRVTENWLANCRPFTHRRKNNPNAEAHILSAFGGNGLTREYIVEKLFRDARAMMIEDGANDILAIAAGHKLINSYPRRD